jgi:hypothetical protein
MISFLTYVWGSIFFVGCICTWVNAYTPDDFDRYTARVDGLFATSDIPKEPVFFIGTNQDLAVCTEGAIQTYLQQMTIYTLEASVYETDTTRFVYADTHGFVRDTAQLLQSTLFSPNKWWLLQPTYNTSHVFRQTPALHTRTFTIRHNRTRLLLHQSTKRTPLLWPLVSRDNSRAAWSVTNTSRAQPSTCTYPHVSMQHAHLDTLTLPSARIRSPMPSMDQTNNKRGVYIVPRAQLISFLTQCMCMV